MRMHLSFTYDDHNYKAECERQNGRYSIENIRIDFADGIANIPIRSMKIHCLDFDGILLWMDEDGNSNLLINTFGNAIIANMGNDLI